jgi:hypothetical protein
MGQEGWSTPATRSVEKEGIRPGRWELRFSPAGKEAGLLGSIVKPVLKQLLCQGIFCSLCIAGFLPSGKDKELRLAHRSSSSYR